MKYKELSELKEYAVLENGRIEPLYYPPFDDGTREMRWIEEEDGSLCLCYDELFHDTNGLGVGFRTYCVPIVFTADTEEECEVFAKKLNECEAKEEEN